MRTLAFIITFLALRFWATAGESPQQSDGEIRQKIVGTWTIDLGKTNQTYSAKGTVIYSSNGCYVAKATIWQDGKAHEEKYGGLWHVEDGVLTDTVTNATGIEDGFQPKIYEVARVIRVDEKELVMQHHPNTKAAYVDIEKRSK